ncbi:MAG: cation-transporting P-type ATPase, partial [Pseudomonadota bacterium]
MTGNRPMAPALPETYWALSAEELLHSLNSDDAGLAPADAATRLRDHGPNSLEAIRNASALGLFINQFKSPLVLILIFASVISLIAAEWVDAAVVLVIVFGSTILGFVQEYMAGNAIEKLRSQIT